MTDNDCRVLRGLFIGMARTVYAEDYDLRRLEAEWQEFKKEKGHAIEAAALTVEGYRDGALDKEGLEKALEPLGKDVMWKWCLYKAVEAVVEEGVRNGEVEVVGERVGKDGKTVRVYRTVKGGK